MRHLLADLALESEAATALALRLARAVDDREQPQARALLRVGTPAAKLWVCKRAIGAIGECMEVWGGNGYVETGPLPRLFREAPVNSIWEGSGNVMALDVLRALQREPDCLAALRAELDPARGAWPAYDRACDAWRKQASAQDGQSLDPAQARSMAASLARLWQAALLIQHAPAAVADAFVASRIDCPGGIAGELPTGIDTAAILARAWPAIC